MCSVSLPKITLKQYQFSIARITNLFWTHVMTRGNVRKQGWVFPLFSPDSDDRLSLNFHRFVILYRSVGLGLYCLPKVSNGFNTHLSSTAESCESKPTGKSLEWESNPRPYMYLKYVLYDYVWLYSQLKKSEKNNYFLLLQNQQHLFQQQVSTNVTFVIVQVRLWIHGLNCTFWSTIHKVHRLTLNLHGSKIMMVERSCWGAVVFEKWVKKCPENIFGLQ